MNATAPLSKLVNALTNPPKGGGNKKKSKKPRQSRKQSVSGQRALGTNAQGPLMLKNEQFATYAPLTTFSVAKGSTPGGIRIRGRELIQALNSGLTTLVFGGNNLTTAGRLFLIPTNFPRLGAYTPIYEFYKFHRAKAIFQSNQPTTAGGVSILAVDYDAKDAIPATTVDMMRNISSSMSNVYADNACEISGALSRLPKFATGQATSSDPDQVNQASILYAFEGVTGANVAQGYLVVEYDVEFFTPQ